jgi:hypothetical protein
MVQILSCGYCQHGLRCPCTCDADCGARETAHCPKAPDFTDYLRRTGLYSEAELERIAADAAASRAVD